jgi:hypothetical protein
MIRVVISDNVLTGHPELVRAAILAGYGSGLTQIDVEIRNYGLEADLLYASSVGAIAVVRSLVGLNNCIVNALAQYPGIQMFMPLGSNSLVELSSPSSIPVIVTCGASDTQHNKIAFGNGLEFFDDDNGDPGQASSFSNGIIAGKLLKIKDALGCSWWEARYRGRMTASIGLWNKNDGYGIIDIAAAIAFVGIIPHDPYIPIATPVNLVGTRRNDGTSILLTWNTQTYAPNFGIYRSDTMDGTYEFVASSMTNAYIDTGLNKKRTYCYKISAYDSAQESTKTPCIVVNSFLKAGANMALRSL